MRLPLLLIVGFLSGCSITSSSPQKLPNFTIELDCAQPPPGEDTDLSQLFDHAEAHDGEFIYADVAFRSNCECNTGTRFLNELTLACERNEQFYLYEATRDYRCVQSLHLAGPNAGIASLCFPRPADLPRRAGYSADIRVVEETIRAVFLAYWDWSGGAPHVNLVVPESGAGPAR